MSRLPLLGQFLGRLCWNPHVTADSSSRRLLLQCLLALYSEHPSNAVERKSNQWIRWVTGKLVPISSSLWARGRVHPGQVASPSQGNTQTTMHTLIHTPKGNLERPINLTGMSLDCGRKPEYPVRTHACTGRTCKLHAERPPAGNRTQDLLAARQQYYQLRHRAALP
ncbi:hypothetical protein ATANTOWER_011019 [Ataeniobius toweri]|uniref:Secreted protein n=1 Tax=Ataeniobius toweri TaxID=208326 RepID=A0ABU7APU8_9TELE|nr:hypothetical protein [Ataeniobius toweri]